MVFNAEKKSYKINGVGRLLSVMVKKVEIQVL